MTVSHIRSLIVSIAAGALAVPCVGNAPPCTFPNRVYGWGADPSSVAIGDLDGDLDLDLAVANEGSDDFYDSDGVSVLLNNGDGTFAADVTYGAGDEPFSVAIGDLDGDLDLDLAVANKYTHDVSVLLNNGDGTFAEDVTYGAGQRPQSVAIGDLDGDLDLDLAVANVWSHDVSVLMNNGDGTFAEDVTYGAGGFLMLNSVAIGDLDGDLDLDLAVAFSADGFSGGVSVLLNNGNGTFPEDVTYFAGAVQYSVAIGDLDGDLDLDLAVANRGTWNDSCECNVGGDRVSVLLNNGDGTFADDVTYGAGDFPSSVAIGDLDGDLDLDLAVTNLGSDDVSVLLNHCTPTSLCTAADIDGNGVVNSVDLLIILAMWGGCPPDCRGDVNDDGIVDVLDLLIVIGAWGPCAE